MNNLHARNPSDDEVSYFPLGTWLWSRLGEKRREEREFVSFSFFF